MANALNKKTSFLRVFHHSILLRLAAMACYFLKLKNQFPAFVYFLGSAVQLLPRQNLIENGHILVNDKQLDFQIWHIHFQFHSSHKDKSPLLFFKLLGIERA